MKVKDETRIIATEMKFKRKMVKYSWMDSERNEHILKELKESVLEKILKYKTNWIQHVDRRQRDRLPKLLKITDHMV
jgi:hypothetical protein